MITVKDAPGRVSKPKRNITIDGVTVEDGQLVDEMGNIAEAVADALPDGATTFTIKITIDLPEDEDM